MEYSASRVDKCRSRIDIGPFEDARDKVVVAIGGLVDFRSDPLAFECEEQQGIYQDTGDD